MKISDIIHYPVKSLAGNHLEKSEVHERGLKDDRRLMLIDENNNFVSQRAFPYLSQIEVGITEDDLVLRDRRSNEFLHQELKFELAKTDVTVWRSKVTSHSFLSKEADNWITERFGKNLRFVYMDESDHRHMNPDFASEDELVSFADGYPILICNTASLKALNSSMSSNINMDHFRPNIVIDIDQAWIEDDWKRLKINDVVLRIAKPCARCKVINIDPENGEINPEVLQALGKMRIVDNKILFGMNAIVEKTGMIAKGDNVKIM